MSQLQKIILGIVLGVVFPLILVGIINLLLIAFDKYLTTEIFESSILFGVGVNAILIWFVFKEKKEPIGRGMIVSSFFIFIYWAIRFMVLEN